MNDFALTYSHHLAHALGRQFSAVICIEWLRPGAKVANILLTHRSCMKMVNSTLKFML